MKRKIENLELELRNSTQKIDDLRILNEKISLELEKNRQNNNNNTKNSTENNTKPKIPPKPVFKDKDSPQPEIFEPRTASTPRSSLGSFKRFSVATISTPNLNQKNSKQVPKLVEIGLTDNTSVTNVAPPPPPPPPPPFFLATTTQMSFGTCPTPPPPPPPPPFLPISANSSATSSTTNLACQFTVPKSEIPMKPFHWTKRPAFEATSGAKTIFEYLSLDSFEEMLNINEISHAFAKYPPLLDTSSSININLSDESSNSNESGKLKMNNSACTQDRARNIEMLLKHVRIPIEKAINFICEMDVSNSMFEDDNNINQLITFTPNQNDREFLELNKDRLDQMDRVCTVLFYTNKVFHYREKLETIKFMKNYSNMKNEFGCKLENVLENAKNLEKSENVQFLFGTILFMGNFINQDNQYGNANGFKLNTLDKLISYKLSNSAYNESILHFLIRAFSEKVKFFVLFFEIIMVD